MTTTKSISDLSLKKRAGISVPVHKNCLFDSQGHILFKGKNPKISFGSRTIDAYCCGFLFSNKNDGFLGIYLPVEKRMLHDVSGHDIFVSPGEYKITNTFELSKVKFTKNQKYTKWKSFSVSPELIKDILKEFEINKDVKTLEFNINSREIDKLLQSAFNILEGSFENTPQEDNYLLIETAALQIVTLLLKHHPNNFQFYIKSYKIAGHYAIKRALDYIRDNYNKRISLDDIASSAYLNKCYLVELFKQETGKTPFSYVINYRIEKAKELLKYNKLKLEQVVKIIGYEDERQFRRLFKQVTGYTPSSFR